MRASKNPDVLKEGLRMNTEPVEVKFNKLPEHLKKEVIDFI